MQFQELPNTDYIGKTTCQVKNMQLNLFLSSSNKDENMLNMVGLDWKITITQPCPAKLWEESPAHMVNTWICAVKRPVRYPEVFFLVFVEPLSAPWRERMDECESW